ncbi:MAG: YggS family pyridoxal phosphate-dependent enzyme [Acholeplasmatales bacterium]|nr:YggS family pyridoxal phosphate-dependent enzyme [Acholeplasmatales bacterium]
MKLRSDIDEFIKTIPDNVNIVAATKYVGAQEMMDLYKHNIKNFGENRVDSFNNKYEELKDVKDIKWHFIGHLQRNKCKDIINKIDYLHSLDSIELAKMIEKYRVNELNTFIEVSINLEENKNGVDYHNIYDFVGDLLNYKKIKIIGLMMMAIKNDNDEDLKDQFDKLYNLRNDLEKKFNISIPYLSMGISDDYKIAIDSGATHVRLGRILWEN